MPTRLPAPALVLDDDGLVVDANVLALSLLGRPRGELVGQTVGEVVEARDVDGSPLRLRTLRSRQPDGTVLCLLREVRGDELVDDVMPYFHTAFDHAPIGMAIIGSDGRYVRVNDALCAMLGRSREELIGTRDSDLTHPDDRERDVELAWRILRGELDAVQLEKRFVKPDGSIVWAITNVTYLRDDDGVGIAWVGQWQDVTAHRAVQAELRRERDLSAAMLGAIHEGFCLVADERIVEVNEVLCDLVGWSRDELVGRRWPFPWVPDEQVERQAELAAEWMRAGGGQTDDFILRHRDGRRFPASVSASRATGPDGEEIGVVVTLCDISERKRYEEELARQATHDTLTGLLNHRGFQERLRQEIARSRRSGTPLSLAILDLDHFKHVNDRFGHPVGDNVLGEVGRRFRALARAGEHVARIGGEEFAWILPETAGPGAYAAAERARRALEREPFAGVGGLTVSAGVCELGVAGDADELHRLADVALYWAKDHGRNIVFRWTPETAAHLQGDADATAVVTERGARLRALHAVARMVEQGHPSTDGHAERVAELAVAVAERLGWEPGEARALREAGLLHDVGKVVVPKSVLLKPGALTALEWTQIRQHPAIADGMLEGVLSDVQRGWVRGHHERWDGAGYPDAIAGWEIPGGARILAVADAWDAMTSERVYRPPLAMPAAVAEVRRSAGSQFDPRVAQALLDLVAAGATAETA